LFLGASKLKNCEHPRNPGEQRVGIEWDGNPFLHNLLQQRRPLVPQFGAISGFILVWIGSPSHLFLSSSDAQYSDAQLLRWLFWIIFLALLGQFHLQF